MLLLAFLGGMLTILSPCILPVIPLVFARAERAFVRETLPLLAGLAVAFTVAALIATTTARWILVANELGRTAALLVLAAVGASLLSTRVANWVTRPIARVGASVLAPRPGDAAPGFARNVGIGMAIGLLWAPCAGPILGVLIAAAAVSTPPRAASLFLTFALGAVMALAIVINLGARALARLKRAGAAEHLVRRTLGIATLATVVALSFGWDRVLFADAALVRTARAENSLVNALTPGAVPTPAGSQSLDEVAAEEAALAAPVSSGMSEGMMPGFAGGTEWINSPLLTPESLRGKVVMVEFWTYGCYNCLNALPHVKALYAKYRDRGFVVVGVHTPEFAHERVPANVKEQVRKLGVTFPVVIDNDHRIWNAYDNRYWPAAYYADATGKLRFHHFGEGRYAEQDLVVARLLAERDAAVVARGGTR